MTEGQAVSKPDQSAPTPEEINRQAWALHETLFHDDARPGIPLSCQGAGVCSYRVMQIKPILTRLYHATKIAGQIEALNGVRGGFVAAHEAGAEHPETIAVLDRLIAALRAQEK